MMTTNGTKTTEAAKTTGGGNIATMTAAELTAHIKELDDRHKARLRTLRALQRARQAEESAKQ